MTPDHALRAAAVSLVVTALLIFVCCLSGCSERAENALAYGGAAVLGALAFLLIVVCLSGFEIRGGRR